MTGGSPGATSDQDYATIAYNAATGAQLWVSCYNGPGDSWDAASSLAVGPGGKRVFVTGQSTGATSDFDYATIAYSAVTGAQLWVRRYTGSGSRFDSGYSMAMSRTGSTVYVTGGSTGATSGYDYATIAYNAATGARLWVRRYNGPGNGEDSAYSMAVSPSAGTLFVTGSSYGKTSNADYATIAYRG